MLPSQARAELAISLRKISEDAMCASWYGDIEFIIWDRLHRGPSRLGQLTLTKDILQKLSTLSQQAGGWVHLFDEEDEGGENVRFIDSDAWDKRFKEWLARVPEGQRPRDR